MENPVSMFEDNLLMNLNTISVAHKTNVDYMICCLSTCIFPDRVSSYPITEDILHEGPPHHSNQGYAYAKRFLEIQCRLYNEHFNRKYLCVSPTNVFGPHDNFNIHNGHVIPSLIHKAWIANSNQNDYFTIYGSGEPLRQFVYSLDLAKILIQLLLKNIYSHHHIIISPSIQYSIMDVARKIANVFDLSIQLDTSKSDGQLCKKVSSSRLLSILEIEDENQLFTPFDTALKSTIQWFQDNYEIARK